MRTLAVVGVVLLAAHAWADTTQLKDLEGDDDERAAQAAQALGDGNDAQAVATLIPVLEDGAPRRVQAAILDALAKKKDARALAVLTLCTHHRSVDSRKKAGAALAAINDARGDKPIVAA